MTLHLFYWVVSARSYGHEENTSSATFTHVTNGKAWMHKNADKSSWHTGFWTFGNRLNIILFRFLPLSPDKNVLTLQTACKHVPFVFIVVLDLSVLRFTIPIKVTHIGEFCLLINIFTSYASTPVPLKINSCLRITFQVIIYRNSSTWILTNLRQDDGCLAIWPRTNNPIEKVWGHVL